MTEIDCLLCGVYRDMLICDDCQSEYIEKYEKERRENKDEHFPKYLKSFRNYIIWKIVKMYWC